VHFELLRATVRIDMPAPSTGHHDAQRQARSQLLHAARPLSASRADASAQRRPSPHAVVQNREPPTRHI